MCGESAHANFGAHMNIAKKYFLAPFFSPTKNENTQNFVLGPIFLAVFGENTIRTPVIPSLWTKKWGF